MREVTTADETREEERRIQVGVSATSHSPQFAVSHEVAEAAEDGDFEAVEKCVADWWDTLDTDERTAVLGLGELSGRDLLEQMAFIDVHSETTGDFEPVFES